jgi:hypothetical protein
VYGSAEQRALLNSHCTGLSTGQLQKPSVASLQTLSPGQVGHVVPPVHTLSTQVWLGSHGSLQAPQCWALVFVSVSQPLECSPSQLPKPAAHALTVQAPPAQTPSAFGNVQATTSGGSFETTQR